MYPVEEPAAHLFFFFLFYQKHYQSVTPTSENIIDLLLLMGLVC